MRPSQPQHLGGGRAGPDRGQPEMTTTRSSADLRQALGERAHKIEKVAPSPRFWARLPAVRCPGELLPAFAEPGRDGSGGVRWNPATRDDQGWMNPEPVGLLSEHITWHLEGNFRMFAPPSLRDRIL